MSHTERVEALQGSLRRILVRSKSYRPSESDTIALLIEPVLRMAGWDPDDLDQVRRISRDCRSAQRPEFDIVTRNAHGGIQLGIEAKSLLSPCDLREKVDLGILTRDVRNRPAGRTGDFVGQIRGYTCRYHDIGNTRPMVPCLSNGDWWFLFDYSSFVHDSLRRRPVTWDQIPHKARLSDSIDGFVNGIVKPLHRLRGQ